MKKLLFFASDFKIGLSQVLTDQLISIHEFCNDVKAVAGENEQEPGLAQLLADSNVDIYRINGLDKHANFKKLYSIIRKLVLDNDIDVIHVQNNWQLAIVGAVKYSLLFRHNIKIVYTIHGFRNNKQIKSRIAQCVIGSALLLLADHIICMPDYLKRNFRLLSYKINLIPLGISDSFFTPTFQSPRTDALHLIFPAQFREGKKQDIIIRAFARYITESHDTTSSLTLPGCGEMQPKMQSLAKRLGISRNVIFPGLLSKDQIKQQYLLSNVAIVASNSETFGQSIVEPYVLGRCVISTPVGIAPEIIKDGINGFIIHSEQQLCEILHRLACNKSLLSIIGATNFAERYRFKWQNITNQYVKDILE